MRKFLISIALVSTTLAVTPATAEAAQSRSGWDQRDDDRRGGWDRDDDRRGGWDRRGPSRQAQYRLFQDLQQVEQRIHHSAQRRIISPREAVSLRREANWIRVQLRRSGRNGLSGREFAMLQQRVNRLEQRLRHERRDRDGRRW